MARAVCAIQGRGKCNCRSHITRKQATERQLVRLPEATDDRSCALTAEHLQFVFCERLERVEEGVELGVELGERVRESLNDPALSHVDEERYESQHVDDVVVVVHR